MTSFSRYIPTSVREKLRNEVNFGCPVSECGIPYLKYHHYDPPFVVLEKMKDPEHDPEKIIALCSKHADLADGGKWLDDDLRKMKKNPYITDILQSEEFGYLRKKIVFMVGNVAYNVPNVIEINGERVVGFELDSEGNLRLNILIRDNSGKKILVMENNDWIVQTKELFNLECPPQGKEIRIEARDGTTKFKMRFDDYSLEKFREYLYSLQPMTNKEIQEMEKRLEWLRKTNEEQFNKMIEDFKKGKLENVDNFIHHIGLPEIITVFSATGTLSWGDNLLSFTENKIEDLKRNNIFRCSYSIGGKTAFSFKESGGFSMGVKS